jgi:hypothetical protein
MGYGNFLARVVIFGLCVLATIAALQLYYAPPPAPSAGRLVLAIVVAPILTLAALFGHHIAHMISGE